METTLIADRKERESNRQGGFVLCAALTARFCNAYRDKHGVQPTGERVTDFLLEAADLYNGGVMTVSGIEGGKLLNAAWIKASSRWPLADRKD